MFYTMISAIIIIFIAYVISFNMYLIASTFQCKQFETKIINVICQDTHPFKREK